MRRPCAGRPGSLPDLCLSADRAHGCPQRPGLLSAPPTAHADPTNTPVLGAGKVQADINGDGYADLIVSAIRSADEEQVGSVAVLYGSATGLTTTGQQRIDGDDLPGIGPDNTLFDPGALAAGDFNNDGYSDLVIAAVQRRRRDVHQAGVVYVIPGSAYRAGDLSDEGVEPGHIGASPAHPSPATPSASASRPPTSAGVGRSTWPSASAARYAAEDRLNPSGLVQVLYGTVTRPDRDREPGLDPGHRGCAGQGRGWRRLRRHPGRR